MGEQSISSASNAWEVSFKDTIEGGIFKIAYIVSSKGPLLQYTVFLCQEDAVDALWPAYEKFKETFAFY